jgi:hypothetical protein
VSDVIGAERIGQLTGTSRICDQPELTTDWTFWPLLNETNRWGVKGVDLGANTEHDGCLYIFFGDVAIDNNPDVVCWSNDTVVQRHGGHVAIGWDFRLPNDHQGAKSHTLQWQWRFCEKCHGIFFCPEQADIGVCPAGRAHRPIVCPAGGPHHIPEGSWVFFLPALETGASDAIGQPRWRFCANCHSLFWNGDSIKGVCPLGGGFRLNAVLDQAGKFIPFKVDEPIGLLGQDSPGWAYGAHFLKRFTKWDPAGFIELYYLLSTASPYQVHLMHTRIRFG